MHVLAVVVGMGGALVSDALFSFFSKDKVLNKKEMTILELFSKIVLYSLFIIALSGVFIFLSNPAGYMTSAKFLSKMSVIAVLIVNGYILNTYVWSHLLKKKFFTAKGERSVRRVAFASGAVSVVSWVSALGLGMSDGFGMSYQTIMTAYILITFIGVCVALLVEKNMLN